MKLRLSESAKSNIDIIVPVLGAAYAFYYLRKQEMKMERMLIYTVIAFLVLYLITTRVTKQLRSVATMPSDVPRANPNEPSGVNNFVASEWSDRIFKDINGWNWNADFGGRDVELYRTLSLMSNDQLTQVANQYKNDYYTKHSETLIQALKNEYMWSDTARYRDNIISRLTSIGFN